MNINIHKNYKGIKVVPLGISDYNENVEAVIGEEVIFHTNFLEDIFQAKNKCSDVDMVDKGYISATPFWSLL